MITATSTQLAMLLQYLLQYHFALSQSVVLDHACMQCTNKSIDSEALGSVLGHQNNQQLHALRHCDSLYNQSLQVSSQPEHTIYMDARGLFPIIYFAQPVLGLKAIIYAYTILS